MVGITETAAQELKRLLAKEKKEGVRIYLAGLGCGGPQFGMTLDDKKKSGDEEVIENGVKIFLDKNTLDQLDGTDIDYIKNDYGEGFILRNPKGCGSSCNSCR